MPVVQRQFPLPHIKQICGIPLGYDAGLLRNGVPVSSGIGCRFGPENAASTRVLNSSACEGFGMRKGIDYDTEFS